MGFWDEVKEGLRHSREVNKQWLKEAVTINVPILGTAIQAVDFTKAQRNGWVEIKCQHFPGVPDSATEIGTLRYYAPDIEVKGYSVDGFYVRKDQKAAAVTLLKSTGLDVS